MCDSGRGSNRIGGTRRSRCDLCPAEVAPERSSRELTRPAGAEHVAGRLRWPSNAKKTCQPVHMSKSPIAIGTPTNPVFPSRPRTARRSTTSCSFPKRLHSHHDSHHVPPTAGGVPRRLPDADRGRRDRRRRPAAVHRAGPRAGDEVARGVARPPRAAGFQQLHALGRHAAAFDPVDRAGAAPAVCRRAARPPDRYRRLRGDAAASRPRPQ